MGVEKFYAIYEHLDGTNEIIDVFQAINLVSDAIIVTKPKSVCPLFDIDTYLKVSPVRGRKSKKGIGEPYFRYYTDEDSPLKGIESQFEYTPELKIFIRAFEKIQSFKIEEWENEIVEVIPKNMQKFRRIETEENFVILKFFVELEETKPYSYYYKYNGRLGLEFSVTSQPEPIKRKSLEREGIPLFRSNISIPAWITLPKGFEEESEFEHIASEVRDTYEKRNYRLQGKFLNQAINFPKYKEKYAILNNFERQCAELEEEKQQLECKITKQQKLLEKYKVETENQRKLIIEEKKILDEYRKEIVHFEKLNDDNKVLTYKTQMLNQQLEIKDNKLQNVIEDNTELKVENANLTSQKIILTEELADVTSQIESLQNKGFLKKIFKKKE